MKDKGTLFVGKAGYAIGSTLLPRTSNLGIAPRSPQALAVEPHFNGQSFCIRPALFPNKKDSWTKIAESLKGTIDEEAFEACRTLVSLPFRSGTSFDMQSGQGRVQVKVIDQRGNAVVKTVKV